ncbi:hypothetical protein [Mesorhizobium sp. B2-1-3A]|uniref:hypothetical protein n=1 Tax=Mesorhizobium sp. B2-1-3A TaxID=2589971 RepID=UPI001129DD33|nr:hypothetical protein [Mesorhizobium sp. B2-1-3A]TPM92730.1 hypothetical protein FJ977_28020 [Mesorhizobium sp. B2-1-3A]
MDKWLKILIAAACVAVIAAVGYFALGEYKAYRLRAEIEAGRESARAELFDLAKAKPYEIDKVRDFCKTMSDRRYGGDDNSEMVRILVRNCSGLGYN